MLGFAEDFTDSLLCFFDPLFIVCVEGVKVFLSRFCFEETGEKVACNDVGESRGVGVFVEDLGRPLDTFGWRRGGHEGAV